MHQLSRCAGSELTQGDMAAMAGRLDVASKSERPQGKLGSKTSMKAGVAAAVAVMGAAGAAKAPAVSTRVKYKKKKVGCSVGRHPMRSGMGEWPRCVS